MFRLMGVLLCVHAIAEAACPGFPAAYDVKTLTYNVEKLASSVVVEITFPRLSNHPSCVSGPAHFGTLWEWTMDSSAPIYVKVFGKSGAVVQDFSYTGALSLKTTTDRATLHFFDLKPSKRLLDHRIVTIELWNQSPLFPLPSFEVEESGARMRISGKLACY